ncbi:MAG TPA: HupE/UreJ family protein [Chthoniobacteraceae bacterium]|jgi:urease accessory protein
MRTTLKSWGAVAALTLLPNLAHAHPGHDTAGLAEGFAHPLLGLDHILAMLAVGLWAVQLGGRAFWVVPASFVTSMILGGALGISGMALPFAEQGILASVLILGLLIAAAARLPLVASAVLVGAFSIFHGFAHGAEMPIDASGLSYGGGFVAATALLHGAGIAAGLMARQFAQAQWIRAAGGAIALAAVLLAFEII